MTKPLLYILCEHCNQFKMLSSKRPSRFCSKKCRNAAYYLSCKEKAQFRGSVKATLTDFEQEWIDKNKIKSF